MGWSFYHREKGESNVDHFNREFFGSTGEKRIIDGATKNGVFYGALRIDGKSGGTPGAVTAIVVLTKWVPNDPYNFGYKEMDEGCGPCDAECPERILKLLSPLNDCGYGERSAEWALRWREACWENVEKLKRARKVKPGTTVRFGRTLKFTSGAEHDTLTFVKGNVFADEYGRRYRVTGWRTDNFEVVGEGVTV